eukprot:gene19172-biopygen14543
MHWTRGWRRWSGRKRWSFGSQKRVLRSVGIPSGSYVAPWWHLQKVVNFEILMLLCLLDLPAPGPPGSAVLLFPQLPASPQHPQAPGTANSTLEHVLRSEWRKRISAHKAAPKANAQGPGLAGAVRTQKNVN